MYQLFILSYTYIHPYSLIGDRIKQKSNVIPSIGAIYNSVFTESKLYNQASLKETQYSSSLYFPVIMHCLPA
jgi:hypothetical protein